MSRRIFLVGYGMDYSRDRSVRVDRCLSQVDAIFTLEPTDDHLRPHLPKNLEYSNLFHLYQDGVPRDEIYESAATAVMRSLKRHQAVAFLTEGSPHFLNRVSDLIAQKAALAGVDVESVPGLSSLDLIIHQLRLPLTIHGISIHTAAAFCKIVENPGRSSILILFQPGNIDSKAARLGEPPRKGLAQLRDKLARCLGESARWIFVNIAATSREPTKLLWGPLSNLESFHSLMHSGTLIVSSSWWPEFLEGTEPTVIDDGESLR